MRLLWMAVNHPVGKSTPSSRALPGAADRSSFNHAGVAQTGPLSG